MTRHDRDDLYRLAYDEGIRALEDQQRELEAMRQRTTQFLAFIGAGTAFLVGIGAKLSERDWVFYTLAAAGTSFALISICAVIPVLLLLEPGDRGWGSPRRVRWRFHLNLPVLIAAIEPEVGTPLQADYYKHLVKRLHESKKINSTHLAKIRRFSTAVIFFGVLQLVCWTALVWVRG